MTLKEWELISILLAALVMGVFWGPWVGLTRSIASFEPESFLAVGYRLNQNLAPLMTVLMPVSLVAMLPVLFLSSPEHPMTFRCYMGGFVLFVVALLVTVIIEVPIAQRIKTWTTATLPGDWSQQRDRWASVHIVRVVSGIGGLALLVIGAVYG